MLQRHEDRRRALINAVLEALGRNRAKGLREFGEHLFANAPYEDLAPYTAEELARLAAESWSFSASRQSGRPKVRFHNPEPPEEDDDSALSQITVVEAINDNMPFLVDSAMAELHERGYEIRCVLHPIVAVERDGKGRRQAFLGSHAPDDRPKALRESVVHIHVSRIDSEAERKDAAAALGAVYDEVRVAVRDWRAMVERLSREIAGYKTNPPPIAEAEVAEAIAFLEWIADDNFTFLGMREYAFVGEAEQARLERVVDESGAGLGLLSDPEVKVLRRGREYVTVTPEIREFLMQPVPLIVTKANVKARVHRRAHMDYIGLKTFDDDGRLTGELRIIGLFTSTAYNRSVRFIPHLRRKVDLVMERAGFDPASHNGKALMNVMETFPRDELFQVDTELLLDWSLAILQLGERPRVRVLARVDKFDRFVSVLVYCLRDRFTTSVRIAIGEFLAEAFQGKVSASYPSFPEGTLVRVHYIIGRYEGETPRPDQAWLEGEVARLTRTWTDNFREALYQHHKPLRADELFRTYDEAFSGGYQQTYSGETAVHDLEVVVKLTESQPLAISFHRPWPDRPEVAGLKLFRLGNPVPLSERVPILENMGFKVINERSFRIDCPDDGAFKLVWLHDMVLERADGEPIDLGALSAPLEAAFMAVNRGLAENDGYNALVVEAELDWRDIAMLRAYSRYLRQARIPYSQDYMWSTLNRHPELAALLVELFHVRFKPDGRDKARRAEQEKAILGRFEDGLDDVPVLDEDRILRRMANAIQRTLRTNFFQSDSHGRSRPALAFKFDSRRLDELPEPRPFAEIFVYSPRVEGVHLRGGKIARGGLRWSDRQQDFRTEVLGLVKAQEVKNAVIVPVGAKGGFVAKQPPAGDRQAMQDEGVACYRIFVGSLLDVTDNLRDGEVIPPQSLVRHDDDDAYLVVAADKGTATFSDIANEISQGRDFWLDDAFASGGSAGYDHKEMGITARGGWEAVKRHFREMDHDIQSEPFTVVGCGDMSGDVFGNGMLLSDQIRLLAAFDHRDIFIDPDPDPAKSFAERKRLFELERSTWQDYDRKLISKGGGVFSRSAKSIPLSPEMQSLLEIERKSATPAEIVSAILKARADLMWFGGIGTYVRASDETDESVGDRANDALRVTGAQLRVKVVGEGANLGMTQKGRIEFARHGGRVNTDAIDNSGGVNSSDMEVNIKVALSPVLRAGEMSLASRNRLLAEMSEEVAELVLRNNSLQTLALSLSERRGREDIGFEKKLMHDLEDRGLLNRDLEALPRDSVLADREEHDEGLVRPELAVLLAYAKIDLYDRLLDSDVPDDPYLQVELMRYFPRRLQQRCPGAIESHQLRREIISTMLANSMINRGGPSMVVRLGDQSGAAVADIARAFVAARNAFQLTELNTALDGLDNAVAGELQLALYTELQDLLLGATAWFLANCDLSRGLADIVGHYRGALEKLAKRLARTAPKAASARIEARQDKLVEAGVPEELAHTMAILPWMQRAPDIVLISDRTGKPLAAVAETYFCLGEDLRIAALEVAARDLGTVEYYDRLALQRALDQLSEAQRRLTAELLATGKKGAKALQVWREVRADDLVRVEAAMADVERGPMSLARIAVAAGLLYDLVGD